MIKVVDRIPDDWMADQLRERDVIHLNADGSNSLHRVQTIYAKHDNNQYQEETDLGEASLYDHEPMLIAALGRTMVGKVREMAERERAEATLVKRYGLEVPDFKGLYLQYAEEAWKQKNHISTFGAGIRTR